MKITPRASLVLIEIAAIENETASGLILSSEREVSGIGLVREVGPEVTQIRPGDRIVYEKFTGTEMEVEGVKYLLLREKEIKGILDESAALAMAQVEGKYSQRGILSEVWKDTNRIEKRNNEILKKKEDMIVDMTRENAERSAISIMKNDHSRKKTPFALNSSAV